MRLDLLGFNKGKKKHKRKVIQRENPKDYGGTLMRKIAVISTTVLLFITAIVNTDIPETFATKSGSGLNQIPSEPTDFPSNDPNAIEIHVIGAKKDSQGDYYVKGEIKNLSNNTLEVARVTGHFYDNDNQTVGVTSCCYTEPSDIEPGHTAIFDSFALKDDMSGTPTSYRLSFTWNELAP